MRTVRQLHMFELGHCDSRLPNMLIDGDTVILCYLQTSGPNIEGTWYSHREDMESFIKEL